MVSEELGQLRGAVDVLLDERKEREKTKNAPVDWAMLPAEQAAVQWPVLARPYSRNRPRTPRSTGPR
jgi:hypothetical protein